MRCFFRFFNEAAFSQKVVCFPLLKNRLAIIVFSRKHMSCSNKLLRSGTVIFESDLLTVTVYLIDERGLEKSSQCNLSFVCC
jgi:hypothetical protein